MSSLAHHTRLQAAGFSFDATATSGELLFSKLKFYAFLTHGNWCPSHTSLTSLPHAQRQPSPALPAAAAKGKSLFPRPWYHIC